MDYYIVVTHKDGKPVHPYIRMSFKNKEFAVGYAKTISCNRSGYITANPTEELFEAYMCALREVRKPSKAACRAADKRLFNRFSKRIYA